MTLQLKEQERTQAEWNRKARDVVNALVRRLAGLGATADRPTVPVDGQIFYDQSQKRPLWWNDGDSLWRGAAGPRKAITKTANFSQAVTEWTLIVDKASASCTVTLLSPADYPDEEISMMNMQAQTVVSASSNVCPIGSATAGTAILPATIGAWCRLRSDGTYWRVIARGT